MKIQSYLKIKKQLDFKTSNTMLLKHLLIDLSLGLIIYNFQNGDLFLLSQICIPLFLFRMFALMHDCLHNAVTTSKFINNTIGIFSGAFCLLPYEPWKKIHLEHHKWSGNIDKDPSMGLVKKFDSNKFITNRIKSILWRLWLPWSAFAQHIVFWSKSYQFIIQSRKINETIKNVLSVAIPIAIYTQINWTNNILGIFLYLVMVEVINFPHHLQMPMTTGKERLSPHTQYITTRSCTYPSWFAVHFLNNFNLHIEHHLYPSLPWYRLQSAQNLLKVELAENYTEVKNNAWINENRGKNIEEIFAPNLIEHDQKNEPLAA